jgi:hypothetical protein
MARRTMQNLFANNKAPVSTGVKIGNRVMYLHRTGQISVGVTGMKHDPADYFRRCLTPAMRRSVRKQLRGMGHNELVLATIPRRQIRESVLTAMADDGPYGRIV